MQAKAARASQSDLQLDNHHGQRLLERALSIYVRNVHELPEGKALLEEKGLGEVDLLERHRVGYCNGKLTEILPKEDQINEGPKRTVA